MNFDAVKAVARIGRLYPSVILYGATAEERQEATLEVSRILLCSKPEKARACGQCQHCRRLVWPGPKAEQFHPDFHVLERDLRASTSVQATKNFLKTTVATPFEARGQIFVVAEAGTLNGGAADALLKTLEEPPGTSARHFFLLASSRMDLSATLRSRSLSIYLGRSDTLDNELVTEVAEELARSLDAWFATASPLLLMTAASALARIPGWEDIRARKPWATAAAAVLHYARAFNGPPGLRRALYALAQELCDGWTLRLRMITAERILEGLISRHLGELGVPRPR